MSKTVKILRIAPGVNIGSISRTGEQLGQLVIEQGWDSYIAYSRFGGSSTSKLIKIGNKISIMMHALISRLFDACGRGSFFSTVRFVNQLNDIKPDIIHLHNIHSYDINISVLFRYLKQSKTPVVWTQHDCWSYTGHCALYAEANCKKWINECHHCPLTRGYPESWLFDRSKYNYRFKKKLFTSLDKDKLYVVCVSKYIKNDVEQSFLNKYPISLIYNGIDTNVFVPCNNCESLQRVRNRYKLGDGTILLAAATSWTEGKGISDYLSLRDILDNKYTLVFVGIPESMISQLPDGIVGIRRTDSIAEMAELYSVASIVMNLSKAESFGKTTAEGLSCGVPSIVYNCTASPELVDDCTGVVVEKGDVKGVKNAIERIMTWDREQTSKHCRERAVRLFDKNKNWGEYIDLYKYILKRSNN